MKVAVYTTREVVGLVRGFGVSKTTKEIIDAELSDADLEALKRLLKGGRK